MAVARMLRLTVLAHASVVDDVVTRLRSAGVLDVTADANGLAAPEDPRQQKQARKLGEQIADARFLLGFLGRYHKNTAPFGSFVSEKYHMSKSDFAHLKSDLRFQRLYRECVSISDELASDERERQRLVKLADDLAPWADLHLQIADWKGTAHVALFTGTVPASRCGAIREMLRQQVAEVSVEELGPVGTRQAWVVLAHRSQLESVSSVLAATDFSAIDFPGLEGYPAEEEAHARARIAAIEADRVRHLARSRELADSEYAHVVALAEAFEGERASLAVREEFGATAETVVISGWVPARDRDALTEALAPLSSSVDLTFAEPADDEEPPVQLENPRLLQPFETLTDLYGGPKYRELDPTPLFAPFFLLFFAICIGDVGYGAMLILGFYLIKTKLDVAPGVKRFSDLMMIGGAGSMVVGVLLGSYFAIDVASLPAPVRALQVLDPLGQLQMFLVVTVIIGLVQVVFGVLVAAYDAARKGDVAGAVGDQLSTLFFFAMVGIAVGVHGASSWAITLGLGVAMLMKGHALEAALAAGETSNLQRAFGLGWLVLFSVSLVALAFKLTGSAIFLSVFAAATVLGLVFSIGVRRAVVAFLGGAYAVYGMSGFIGDVLSYTRLAALGLSGTLVGYVFNLLAGLVWGGASGLFARGGVSIVFVVGHVFNVAINLLGAFVHPARLQFVEFFSKFYSGGGRAYKPFHYQTKALVLHTGADQEGGSR